MDRCMVRVIMGMRGRVLLVMPVHMLVIMLMLMLMLMLMITVFVMFHRLFDP